MMEAGVPAQGCAKALSAVLGIAIAQGYRKLSGASVFTLPQIEAIENEYGVQLFVVPQELNVHTAKISRSWTDATFVVEGRRIPCQVSLGGARKSANHRFVGFILKGQWFIYLAEEYSGREPLFDVDAMRMATSL